MKKAPAKKPAVNCVIGDDPDDMAVLDSQIDKVQKFICSQIGGNRWWVLRNHYHLYLDCKTSAPTRYQEGRSKSAALVGTKKKK